MTTRTAGIPTRPDSFLQLLVPQLSVINGQSQIYYSLNGKITTAELYLCRQNTHYFSVSPIESAKHVMLFSWIGPHNDRVILFGRGYRAAGDDTVRIKR